MSFFKRTAFSINAKKRKVFIHEFSTLGMVSFVAFFFKKTYQPLSNDNRLVILRKI